MPYPVKWLSSDMADSPVNNTSLGALIGVLKACLVTGFNLNTIVGMTYDAGADEVTVDFGNGAGHGYVKWQIVTIDGADQAEYNGEHRVTAVTADTFTFTPEATPAANTATGATLGCKTAPIGGWEIAEEDAANHVIVFTRTDPNASALTFVLDNSSFSGYHPNSYAYYARARIVENFVDLATYDLVAEQYWPFSGSQAGSGPSWSIIGDGLLFYYLNRYGKAKHHGALVWGDIESVRPGEAYGCVLNGLRASGDNWGSTSSTVTYEYYSSLFYYGNAGFMSIARAYHQLPGAVGWSTNGVGAGPGKTLAYPTPQTNALYVDLAKMLVVESVGLRGFLPGVLQPLAVASPYHQKVVANLPGLEGVPVLFHLCATERRSDVPVGMVAFRLDDWRH